MYSHLHYMSHDLYQDQNKVGLHSLWLDMRKQRYIFYLISQANVPHTIPERSFDPQILKSSFHNQEASTPCMDSPDYKVEERLHKGDCTLLNLTWGHFSPSDVDAEITKDWQDISKTLHDSDGHQKWKWTNICWFCFFTQMWSGDGTRIKCAPWASNHNFFFFFHDGRRLGRSVLEFFLGSITHVRSLLFFFLNSVICGTVLIRTRCL